MNKNILKIMLLSSFTLLTQLQAMQQWGGTSAYKTGLPTMLTQANDKVKKAIEDNSSIADLNTSLDSVKKFTAGNKFSLKDAGTAVNNNVTRLRNEIKANIDAFIKLPPADINDATQINALIKHVQELGEGVSAGPHSGFEDDIVADLQAKISSGSTPPPTPPVDKTADAKTIELKARNPVGTNELEQLIYIFPCLDEINALINTSKQDFSLQKQAVIDMINGISGLINPTLIDGLIAPMVSSKDKNALTTLKTQIDTIVGQLNTASANDNTIDAPNFDSSAVDAAITGLSVTPPLAKTETDLTAAIATARNGVADNANTQAELTAALTALQKLINDKEYDGLNNYGDIQTAIDDVTAFTAKPVVVNQPQTNTFDPNTAFDDAELAKITQPNHLISDYSAKSKVLSSATDLFKNYIKALTEARNTSITVEQYENMRDKFIAKLKEFDSISNNNNYSTWVIAKFPMLTQSK